MIVPWFDRGRSIGLEGTYRRKHVKNGRQTEIYQTQLDAAFSIFD
jgi:hypothetical protein